MLGRHKPYNSFEECPDNCVMDRVYQENHFTQDSIWTCVNVCTEDVRIESRHEMKIGNIGMMLVAAFLFGMLYGLVKRIVL